MLKKGDRVEVIHRHLYLEGPIIEILADPFLPPYRVDLSEYHMGVVGCRASELRKIGEVNDGKG